MTDNLYKVFFIISYESNLEIKIKYSLSNEDGIDDLNIIYIKKVKKDDKEFIISVLSFDINNIKEENMDEKTHLYKTIINFTMKNDIYKQQILFKEGRYNFIYNFQIENNRCFRLIGQSSQLKIFYEAFEYQAIDNKDDILNALILDSINFLKESNTINFKFFLELLKQSYFIKERNPVLLNFQIGKIKLSNNLNPNDYTAILSIIENNPTKFCNEKDDKEKEEINEKFYLILLYFITNYENDEEIKLLKIKKLFRDKWKYLINIIVLYTQYFSNIKIPENYICDILMKVNLTCEVIKEILNYCSSNTKRLEIINQCRDPICEFCMKNDKKLKMIELAPPQKDDNLDQMIYQITSLINYQRQKNFLFLSFGQEYWLIYYKFNQTAESLMLINNIISLYQTIEKNLKVITQLNTSSIPSVNQNNNSKETKDCNELKLQKRLIMPTIGNISVGKSFFLNSMFGINFCQVKSGITTKFILFIRHIDNLNEPRLYKLKPFKKGNTYEFFYNCKEVFTGEENIKNKINQINNENKNSKEAIFYMLEIEIKSIENKEFLNKVDFLDVPGLNEFGEDYINLYVEYIKDMIKYCLILFSVENYNSKDSMEVINILKKNLYVPIENFLIILNKIDIVIDIEKTIHDLKKVVLNNGSFNIYKNTLVPVNSLMLKSEIQLKNNCKFYDFINYYFMEYYNNKMNDGVKYIDFIKKIMVDEKKNLQNFNEIIFF